MSKNQPNNQIDTNKTLTIFGVIVIAVLLAGIVFVGYGILKQAGGPDSETEEGAVSREEKLQAVEQMRDLYGSEVEPVSAEEGQVGNHGLESTQIDSAPTGKILFSGQLIGSPRVTHLFALDLGSGTSGPAQYMPESPTSAMAEFDDQTEPAKLFYLSEASPNDYAIHVTDLETGSTNVLPDGRGQAIRSFEWSEAVQMLAFNRLNKIPDSTVDLTELENWEIVILNADGVQTRAIDKARQPQWSPDGSKLLYFRVDGLYLFDFANNTETLVQAVGEGGRITGTSMMSLSPDGTNLVWTTAKRGVISVYEITSWEPFALAELGRIKSPETEYYWPQFSSDGDFYVVQAIDGFEFNEEAGIETRANPRFEVRSVNSRTIFYSYPLDSFAFNLLFTDDWVAQ